MNSLIATDNQIKKLKSIITSTIDYVPWRDDVVISLTTVPSRLEILKPVIHCLLRQTVSGVPIELHVASSVKSTGETWDSFPIWLSSLQSVQIVKHTLDVGPAMKFLPALSANQRRAVIVLDDDVLYPNNLVEGLLKADARWNGSAAICYRGWRIHHKLSFEQSILTSPKSTEDVHVGIITGHGGYCVRSHHVDLFDLSDLSRAPEECWMMDDIWISVHLSKMNTPKLLIGGSARYKIPIESALGGNREKRNDIALAWFSHDWKSSDLENR